VRSIFGHKRDGVTASLGASQFVSSIKYSTDDQIKEDKTHEMGM
jgi:hypothetical protein